MRTQTAQLLHYGEVYNLWSHLTKAKGCLAKYQTLINHCEEPELASFMQKMLENVVEPEIKKLATVLKDNGVETPPTPQEKPSVDFSSIPMGGRFKDPEIAMCVANDLAMNLTACSQIVALSIREDISKMFVAHHAELVKYGHDLQKIMLKHGWLVIPPLHPAGSNVKS